MTSAWSEEDLARLLSTAERRMTRHLAKVLEANGSSVEEWRVLSCLTQDGGRSMTEIAEFALLPPPTLTKVMDRMVAANLVYRRADVRDRRRVLAFLSRRGRAVYRRLSAAVAREKEPLQTLREREVDELSRLLSRLVEQFD